MTSVYSTRELRPVPKLLVEMVKDPSSLSVIYHGRTKKKEEEVGQEGNSEEERKRAGKGDPKGSQPVTTADSVRKYSSMCAGHVRLLPPTAYHSAGVSRFSSWQY